MGIAGDVGELRLLVWVVEMETNLCVGREGRVVVLGAGARGIGSAELRWFSGGAAAPILWQGCVGGNGSSERGEEAVGRVEPVCVQLSGVWEAVATGDGQLGVISGEGEAGRVVWV